MRIKKLLTFLAKKKSRREIHNQPIKPSLQALGTGCMYHSFVSLTGETSMLRQSNDNSTERFMIRVMDAGYLLVPIYCNGFQNAQECSFWSKYIDYCKSSGLNELRLLVACDGLGTTPSIHAIGVCISFAVGEVSVTVADPVRGDLKTFNQDEFQRTQYAQKAVEVLRLDSAVLEDYPPVPPTP